MSVGHIYRSIVVTHSIGNNLFLNLVGLFTCQTRCFLHHLSSASALFRQNQSSDKVLVVQRFGAVCAEFRSISSFLGIR